MTKPRTPAYFAVARGIGDHPFFNYGKPPLSWREAWEWLIEHAAFKPQGHRHVRGVFALERGDLCATEREMAAAWRWSKTAVHHFIARLAAAGMIRPEFRPEFRGARRRITICNYDKFQPGRSRLDQSLDQSPDHNWPQLPGFATEKPAETKQSIKEEESALATTTRGRPKPKHGQRAQTRAGPMVWVDHGTVEWDIHAKDYQSVRNLAILPKVYQGGRGNWFMVHGEAARNRTQTRRASQRR